jgi:glycosyltransferase involved in cell wall biosynthesis
MRVKDILPLCRPAARGEGVVLSILHLAHDRAPGEAMSRIGRWPGREAGVEHLLLGGAAHPSEDGSRARHVSTGPDLGLDALALDIGILESRGAWIWCVEPDASVTAADVERVLGHLRGTDRPPGLLVLRQPQDPLLAPALDIDGLYNGTTPSLGALVWSRDLLDRHGPFDPHVAIARSYVTEMLLRVVRAERLDSIDVASAPGATDSSGSLLETTLYSDARATLPTWDALSEWDILALDDLERFVGGERAWEFFLRRVLPFCCRYRHVLPGGLPITPQSFPRRRLSALFTKVQYETSNELTFWNYARHFRGSRGMSFSYAQSRALNRPGPLLDLGSLRGLDVVVSTRTADVYNTDLVSRAALDGMATAYLTDDDMLRFHEYGGGFAEFAPGNPHYDAMVAAVRSADVVIGYSDQIRQSVSPHNPRYIPAEDSVPADLLPLQTRSGRGAAPFHFGYAGGGYRTPEFQMLRPAIDRILSEYGGQVRFSFWGLDPEVLGERAGVEYQPFSKHYLEYLGRLSRAGFDAMLVPLCLDPAPKRAKNPNKFMETAIADAVGLYSDVPSYRVVREGLTGLKVPESSDAWYDAMKRALEMDEAERHDLRAAALEYVRLNYSTPALAWTTETGLLAARLHRETRFKRGFDGRPVLSFFFPCVLGTGGGEIQLWRRFEVAQNLGFRLLVVIAAAWRDTDDARRVCRFLRQRGIEYEFVEYDAFYVTPETDEIQPKPAELASLREFFTRRAPEIAVAHSLAFLPAVGFTCSEFGIPHLASIYGIDDSYQFPGGTLGFKYCDVVQSDSIRYARKWSELLGRPWICARETAPAELFDIGFERLYGGRPQARPVTRAAMAGTFMQRKSHLEVIRATALLDPGTRQRLELHLYGSVDTYPEYGLACRRARAASQERGARVYFHGHVRDMANVYRETDRVLSVSTFESFPSAIKEACAAGVLVIASRAGGITELMIDGVNCLLVEEPTAAQIAGALERAGRLDESQALEIRRNAFRLALEEFHPRRTLHDLALSYGACIDETMCVARREGK